jgi:chitodextrinase
MSATTQQTVTVAAVPQWNISKVYSRGAKVTHLGRVWIALRATSGKKPDPVGGVWRKLPLNAQP